MLEQRGWLLDVHSHPSDEVVVWFIGEDGGRHRLRHHFPLTFYAAGEGAQLRKLWRFLTRLPVSLRLARNQRRDLYGTELDCLAVEVLNAAERNRVFRAAYRAFPDLDYYNANISLPIHFHSHYRLFPLAYCRLELQDKERITGIEALDSPWDLDSALPPLRTLGMQPDSNPGRIPPRWLELHWEGQTQRLPTAEPAELLHGINRAIRDYDPDIIASRYGDKWLFPHLFTLAKQHGLAFNPNRERGLAPIQVKENTFSSYGRVVHRDSQTLLLGRVHLDPENSMSFKDYGFFGTYELAKVTGLPLQNAARRSPGGGFTAMQIRAALEREILVPLNKKRHEKYKSAIELVQADNGGLVYQPLTGLHENVAEIDFFSMFPSIMSSWNISPETVNRVGQQSLIVPGLNRPISQDQRGVVSAVLEPVLEKRRRSKTMLNQLSKESEFYAHLESITDTLKWLGWVSFGYQGFSGNRIGSIEAHESINGVSRELLLRAKETAEEHDFCVVHMYVDSLFIKKPHREHTDDFSAIVEKMNQRTGLTLELEGVFNWIAFLPSKTDDKLPVPNCYFGAFQNGEIKCRGIMARRGDSPLYISKSQMRAIRIMARAKNSASLHAMLPKLIRFLRQKYQHMATPDIPLRELVISQRLSRELDEYKSLSAVGRAAQQLALAGKTPRAGQRVDYLRVIGESDVMAWELNGDQQAPALDHHWYREAFVRAAHELVQSFGVSRDTLQDWMEECESYCRPEDFSEPLMHTLPLLSLSSK